MLMIKSAPHFPHLGLRESFSKRTLFFTPHPSQEIIWKSGTGSGTGRSFVSIPCSWRDVVTKVTYVSSLVMSSIPIPFLTGARGVFTVLLTIPLREEILSPGIMSWISTVVPGAKPRFVLIKRPLTDRLLKIPL